MYLARFDTDTGEFVQAVARLETPVEPSLLDEWWTYCAENLIKAARVPDATVMRRTTVQNGKPIQLIVSVLAPASNESRVRALFSALARLESLGGTLMLSEDAAGHDALLAEIPTRRWTPRALAFAAGSIPLACNYRVLPVIDSLARHALLDEFPLVYQVQVRSTTINAEWTRELRKNDARLSTVHGAPQALVQMQAALVSHMSQCTSLVEEFVAFNGGEHTTATIEGVLDDAFQSQCAPLGDNVVRDVFVDGAYAETMELGVHSFDALELPAENVCGQMATVAERDAFLSWRPRYAPQLLVRPAASPVGDSAPDFDARRLLPEAYEGDEPFTFISYRHQDMPMASPIIQRLIDAGVRVWYDRGIPGGAEWDMIIEEKLARCKNVLLFSSRAALQSKYVRREIKYADALNRPVLTVMLEEFFGEELTAFGMRMLLTQYQMLDSREPDFDKRLLAALLP